MKKFIIKLVVIAFVAGLASPAFAAKKRRARAPAFPSFGFVQEMAGVTGSGDIKVDFLNSTAYPTHVRIGAFGGEVMIDPSMGAGATGVGYKHPFSDSLAAYGKLFLDNANSFTNLTAGVAYTMRTNGLIINGNGEVFSCSACVGGASGTFFDLRGAGFFPLTTRKLRGKIYLGGEIDLQLSPSPTTTDIYFGARWLPKSNLIVDIGIITSTGGTTTIATPAFFRLNLGL